MAWEMLPRDGITGESMNETDVMALSACAETLRRAALPRLVTLLAGYPAAARVPGIAKKALEEIASFR